MTPTFKSIRAIRFALLSFLLLFTSGTPALTAKTIWLDSDSLRTINNKAQGLFRELVDTNKLSDRKSVV